jgi:hypothetical protein
MTVSSKYRGLLQVIFISPDEKRLRSGWRLLLQTLIMLILGILFTIPAQAFATPLGGLPNNLSLVANGLGILTSVWIARKFLDRRTFTSLGLAFQGKWLREIGIGILIAAVIMAIVFLVELSLGWLSIDGYLWQTVPAANLLAQLAVWLLMFIGVGYYEEVLSRGYHLQNLTEGLNLAWGLILSSAVFGLLHLGNPNATYISALGITAAGLFLAYGYIRTRALWLSIGLHIGWNFFEGVVFGFPVSGMETAQLIRHTISGPDWFTGGAFGPEGGAASILAMAVGVILITLFTQKPADEQ